MNEDFHKFEIQLAYNEGRRAYSQGKPREGNIYDPKDNKNLALAWWLGWDRAQAEDLSIDKPVGPNGHEP